MNNESYEDLKSWLETSKDGKWKFVAIPYVDPITGQLYCNCVHCTFKVPMVKGDRWRMGNFRRHFLVATTICPIFGAQKEGLSSNNSESIGTE